MGVISVLCGCVLPGGVVFGWCGWHTPRAGYCGLVVFVRKVPGRNGAVKVQIAERRDRRDVVLEHVGTAHNDGELAALMKTASEHLRPGQERLPFGVGPGEAPGQAVVIAQESRLLLEAIRSVYRFFGFEEALGDEAFKQLVLARIVEPTSKADTVRVLDELGVAARHRNSLQSALERINRDGYRGEDRHSVFPPRPVGRGPVPCLVRHDDLVLRS